MAKNDLQLPILPEPWIYGAGKDGEAYLLGGRVARSPRAYVACEARSIRSRVGYGAYCADALALF